MYLKKFLLLIFFTLLILPTKIYAACSLEEEVQINAEASQVQAKYELVTTIADYEGNIHPEVDESLADVEGTGYVSLKAVYLRVLNITNNLYFVIDNPDENIHEAHYANELVDGVFTYQVPNTNNIREYTITIYSNNPSCLDDEVNKFIIKTPMYNQYFGLNVCQNQKDKYYCQEYVTEDMSQYEQTIYNNFNNENQKNRSSANNQRNKLLIIGGIVAIFLITAIITAIIIRRKSLKN